MSKNSKSKRTEATLSLLITSALVITLAIAVASAIKKGSSNNEYGNIVDLNETEGLGFSLDNNGVTDETITPGTNSAGNASNISENRSAKGNVSDDSSDDVVDSKTSEDSTNNRNNLTASKDNASSSEDNTISDENDSTATGNDIAVNAGDSIAAAYSFSESDSLMMPLNGEIILTYSMDSTIWFPTLGVYKCNPGLYIAGEVGSEVVAGASGTVLSITQNEELGNIVTIDMGNGYTASYGQIDNIRVTPGEMVVAGTTIASVAEPTSYYTSEGSGAYFSLLHNNVPENPLDYME